MAGFYPRIAAKIFFHSRHSSKKKNAWPLGAWKRCTKTPFRRKRSRWTTEINQNAEESCFLPTRAAPGAVATVQHVWLEIGLYWPPALSWRPSTIRSQVGLGSRLPAPDRPFVSTYPGQMYAIRSITVRYPERFENDFKSGQPGCLDPFTSSVNGVPGYPDRFWIQFSMAKKNASRLFTCRACSLSGAFRLIFVFDFLYFHSLPPVWSKIIFRQIDTGIGSFAKFRRTPNSLQERPFGSSNWRLKTSKAITQSHRPPTRKFLCLVLTCTVAHATCSETRKKGSFNFHEMTENPERYRAARHLWPSKLGRKSCWYRVSYNSSGYLEKYLDTCKRFALTRVPSTLISGYLAIRIRVNAA